VALRRRHGLRRDTEAARDWLRRRQPLKRETRLKPGAPKERWRPPPAVRELVLRRSRGLCVQCVWRAGLNAEELTGAGARELRRRGVRRATHLHHVLPRQTFPRWERAPDNLTGLCDDCHMNHEFGPDRARHAVARGALPGCALALARAAGGAELAYLERTYPADGGGGDQRRTA
jgi:5-methylcytosine-specific restriction endonuclease McrA